MNAGPLLAGAAVAAVLLGGGALLLGGAPSSVQLCRDAQAAVRAANDANQQAMRALDRADMRARRHGETAELERLRATQAQFELDARRAAAQLACL